MVFSQTKPTPSLCNALIYLDTVIISDHNHASCFGYISIIINHRLESADQTQSHRQGRNNSNPFNPFLQKEMTGGCPGAESLVPTEDGLTAEPRLADHAAELLPLVGGALVPEEHGGGLDDPLGGVVEDADVRVKPDDQVALLLLETDLRGCVGAAEAHDVLEGVLGVDVLGRRGEAFPAAELAPEDGEAEADGGHAAPGGEEAAVVFLRGGAVLLGGSVGCAVLGVAVRGRSVLGVSIGDSVGLV